MSSISEQHARAYAPAWVFLLLMFDDLQNGNETKLGTSKEFAELNLPIAFSANNTNVCDEFIGKQSWLVG